MDITLPVGTTVTDEIEGDLTEQQLADGLVLSAAELHEYHVGTVVAPNEQDIAVAREEVCGYGEPDHDLNAYVVVEWADMDGPNRQWTPSDYVIRIRVAAPA